MTTSGINKVIVSWSTHCALQLNHMPLSCKIIKLKINGLHLGSVSATDSKRFAM